MKRSSDDKARARYEDALRHEGRAGAARAASARHISRRQSEHADAERQADPGSVPNAYGSAPARFESRLERRSAASAAFEARADEAEEAGMSLLAMSRQRRAQQKMRTTTVLLVLPTTVASIMLMAMAHVVFRDWRSYESEASIARAQLNGLQEQLDGGQRRLKSLRSAKGREQILAEHGFIRPGDRLLLFPRTPGESSPEAGAARSQDDIAARRGAIRNATSTSAWDRAARAMTGWLGSLSGSASSSAAPSPAPGTSPGAAAAPAAEPSAAENAAEEEGEAISPEDRIVAPREDAAPEPSP